KLSGEPWRSGRRSAGGGDGRPEAVVATGHGGDSPPDPLAAWLAAARRCARGRVVLLLPGGRHGRPRPAHPGRRPRPGGGATRGRVCPRGRRTVHSARSGP